MTSRRAFRYTVASDFARRPMWIKANGSIQKQLQHFLAIEFKPQREHSPWLSIELFATCCRCRMGYWKVKRYVFPLELDPNFISRSCVTTIH
jgi:hypothetical protein